MKKIIIMLMFVLASLSVFAQTTVDKSILQVVFVNQEPDPAEPGRYVDVRFKIENSGTIPLQDVQVQLMPEFPFSLDEPALKELGTLGGLQNNDRAMVVKYRVRVNPLAIEGTNPLKLQVKTGNSDWLSYTVDVDIRTADSNLAIEKIEINPAPLSPGADATLKVTVKNTADSVLKDISLNLGLNVEAAGISASLPFVPMNSGSEKRILQLNPKEEGVFTYTIQAYPDAASGVYKIPLLLTYRDLLNNDFSKSDIIGLVVNAPTDIKVLLDDNEAVAKGSRGEISVRFINKGLTDIKFMDVVLAESDDYMILSPKEVYIGNIDSDDYETADFNLFIKPGAGEKIPLKLDYEFMDTSNNLITKTDTVEIRIFSEEEAKLLGVTNGGGTSWTMIVIGLLIVGGIVYLIVRKKR